MKHTKWIASDNPEVGEDEPAYIVKSHTSRPYKVTLSVNGRPLTLEVDTGAGVSIISEPTLASLLPSAVLQDTGVAANPCEG